MCVCMLVRARTSENARACVCVSLQYECIKAMAMNHIEEIKLLVSRLIRVSVGMFENACVFHVLSGKK